MEEVLKWTEEYLRAVKEYPSVRFRHLKCQGWIWIYFVFHLCVYLQFPCPASLVVLVINPWPKTRNSISVEDGMLNQREVMKLILCLAYVIAFVPKLWQCLNLTMTGSNFILVDKVDNGCIVWYCFGFIQHVIALTSNKMSYQSNVIGH